MGVLSIKNVAGEKLGFYANLVSVFEPQPNKIGTYGGIHAHTIVLGYTYSSQSSWGREAKNFFHSKCYIPFGSYTCTTLI